MHVGRARLRQHFLQRLDQKYQRIRFLDQARSGTQPFELRGEGKGTEGRYKTMAVEVSSPRVDAKALEEILKQTQQAFASRPQ